MAVEGMNTRTDDAVAPGRYLPIRDYALIGDCHGSALVDRNGSIDWCCLARFDADPVFCRILDQKRGGFLSITPVGSFSTDRAYLDGTNILRTVFKTDCGEMTVTDFMPVGRRPGSGTHNYVDLVAPKWLVRTVDVSGGPVDVRVRYRPAIAFGREQTSLTLERDCISAAGGTYLSHNMAGFEIADDTAEAIASVKSGQRVAFIVSNDRLAAPLDALDRIDEYLSVTAAFWREWITYCRYSGPYTAQVKRSLLTIKLLIYAPSGALAAAPTTSLPEAIGKSRNWDYRFCWLRDTTFALYALAVAGYGGEARRFSEYLPRVCASTAPDLKIMYGIDGETNLDERTLDYLEGYMGSDPVRVGNGAHCQRQMDVYGEVLDWALLFNELGGSFDKDARAMLAALADYVAENWREPDQGIWEMRGPALHHVHGKIMSWVGLDRAIRLLGENQRWAREREAIFSEIEFRGGGDDFGHLVQAYGQPHVDASLLLAPMTAIPLDDGLVRRTVEAVEKELRLGDFLYRYRSEDGVDAENGGGGKEGAFLICSFWLVDAWLHLGKHQEATELLDRLVGHANDVGLYAEEIVPDDHTFLGNFPQAYTHLALVASAAHQQLFERFGTKSLKGSHADRAKLMVSATFGWRALWAAFKATKRVGRIFSSKASLMMLE